jgi:hypothetical protein
VVAHQPHSKLIHSEILVHQAGARPLDICPGRYGPSCGGAGRTRSYEPVGQVIWVEW